MGHREESLDDLGFEIISHTKVVKGTCPMCETKFNKEFDLKTEYYHRCICGYFVLNLEDDTVTVNNSGLPKEEWLLKKQKVIDG